VSPFRRVLINTPSIANKSNCAGSVSGDRPPDSETMRVVQDNFDPLTHSAGALYQTCPPAEARRILRRVEFHYTPSTQAGSTWLRSRSASCGDSASLAGSTTTI
jgi:hypothetical protein